MPSRRTFLTASVLGTAAVLASVLAPGSCGTLNYNCQRMENAVRTAGVIGGAAGLPFFIVGAVPGAALGAAAGAGIGEWSWQYSRSVYGD